MASPSKNFAFVCGPDDFLVGRVGAQRFAALAVEVPDEFSREVLSGFAANVGEVEATVNRFRESVQTVSMFGGRRIVWLKDVNFLADTVTGRAESTLKLVADRDNARVQIFDLDGNFLSQWTHLGSPYSVFITGNDVVYIGDGVNSKVWIAKASDGKLLGAIEDTPGVHWVAVDPAGNVYVASNRNQYLRKYTPVN